MTSVTTDRRFGVNGGIAIKAPCDLATTANITLSGEQSIDGTTTNESRVLVKNQTTTSANGIYRSGTGTWTREPDFNGNRDIVTGTIVLVTGGATNANVFYEVTSANPIVIGTSAITFAQSLTASSTIMSFIQAGTGATSRTAQNKMRDIVSVKDFGAVGDGITDDTTAIQAALDAASHVLVPIGTYLISSTINVPANKKLEFQGGAANVASPAPLARFIKKSTMTTAGITLQQCAVMMGGGLLCQAGNTGDGIQLIGNNAVLQNSYVSGAGTVGVRVGRSDTTYANVNSTRVVDVVSRDNSSHGFFVHDNSTTSAAAASANVNAGALINCVAISNGGDGIKIGRAWWVSVFNALTETNTGWGMRISSTVTAPDTVAEARYTNVFGGDFNETNTAGSLNIAGYAACVYMSTQNQSYTKTGTFCNVFGSSTSVDVLGITVGTFGIVNAGPSTGTTMSTSSGSVVAVATVQTADLYTITRGATIFDIHCYATGAALQTTALVTSDGANHTLTLLKSGASSVLAIVGNAVRVTCANSVTLDWTALRISAL